MLRLVVDLSFNKSAADRSSGAVALDQRFSTGGPRTPGGPRKGCQGVREQAVKNTNVIIK